MSVGVAAAADADRMDDADDQSEHRCRVWWGLFGDMEYDIRLAYTEEFEEKCVTCFCR